MTLKTILPIRRPAAPVLRASLFALMLSLPVAYAPVAQAHEGAHEAPDAHGEAVTTSTGLTIEAPWSRATATGARVAGGYLVLINKGDKDDVLLSGSTDISEKFEVHEMAVTDGVMRMRKLDDGLPVKAGESVELKPGGYHAMFIGLKRPLREGETFTADLVFKEAGTVPVTFAVRSLGARDAGHGGAEHKEGAPAEGAPKH
ncbi:copper chaperone PCu(A)C [Pseudochelatococcus sp. B33]